MPWLIKDVMLQRAEFVALARSGRFKLRQLCRMFNISRPTGYKWLHRVHQTDAVHSLKDRSKRPHHSPNQISQEMEEGIIHLRRTYPCWGAKKLRVLFQEQHPHLNPPSVRTFNRIFSRNHLVSEDAPSGKAYQRFEYEKPNELWQMDFKGDFLVLPKIKCYPLTVLDDHSRYNLVLDAHTGTSGERVQASLIQTFQQHGLPQRILTDRGPAWYAPSDTQAHWTRLTVWLMRLGIEVIHSAAYHPQTLGKDERFHRTLQYDFIQGRRFHSMEEVQQGLNAFRYQYNHIRPHEGIGFQRPSERYTSSPRPFPKKLPEIVYPQGAPVKRLRHGGVLWYQNCYWSIHHALEGERVCLKEQANNQIEVYYFKTRVKTIDLNQRTYRKRGKPCLGTKH